MILTIDKTHELKGNGYLLGVGGENESEQLIINIAYDVLLTKWVYIEFEQDIPYTTERLAIVNGQVVYAIPNGILKQGHVRVQVIFRDVSGFVWKSFKRQFLVSEEINASGSYFNEKDQAVITDINTVNSLYTLTNNGGFENYALVGGVYQQNTFEITDTNKANTIFVRIPSGKTFNDFELKIMLNRGSAIEFRPYAQIDYSIPDAIKALDGYGAEGSNIDFERKLFVNGETTTDISAYITDNYIKVEANGSVVFENDNAQAVPSEIIYAVKRG